jgi:hypothetical protein
MRIEGALALVLVCVATPARGQEPKRVEIPASVGVYSRAIRSDTTRDVEKLYRLGLRAAEDLAGPDSDVLEELNSADYDATTEMMRGFGLTRDEVVVVSVDVEYFSRLSRDRGDQVSLEFFETVGQVEPWSWPTYMERQTDYGGCIKFGSLELVRCYRVLTKFQAMHPGRYRDRIESMLDPLVEEFTEGKCACGSVADMAKEFRAFLLDFPKSPIAPMVRERLHAIEAGTLKMKDHCLPG